jgi:hypothetical protein
VRFGTAGAATVGLPTVLGLAGRYEHNDSRTGRTRRWTYCGADGRCRGDRGRASGDPMGKD